MLNSREANADAGKLGGRRKERNLGAGKLGVEGDRPKVITHFII